MIILYTDIYFFRLKQSSVNIKKLIHHHGWVYHYSLEYIQDYIGVCGLKIWQEELFRIIGYNIEMECNNFLQNKIQSWQNNFQNKIIPIPDFAPYNTQCANFIGKLLKELIRIINPTYHIGYSFWLAKFIEKSQNYLQCFQEYTVYVAVSNHSFL